MWDEELGSEFESDLQNSVDWDRKWLVYFNVGKAQLVSYGLCNNSVAIDGKMGGSVLEGKSSQSSKFDCGSSLSLFVKLPSGKSEPLIHPMKFLSVEACCKSKYDLAWNTVVMSGLMLVVVT